MYFVALATDYDGTIAENGPTAGLKAYDPGTARDRVLSAEEIEALWNVFHCRNWNPFHGRPYRALSLGAAQQAADQQIHDP
jgi:hypothetical protein